MSNVYQWKWVIDNIINFKDVLYVKFEAKWFLETKPQICDITPPVNIVLKTVLATIWGKWAPFQSW